MCKVNPMLLDFEYYYYYYYYYTHKVKNTLTYQIIQEQAYK